MDHHDVWRELGRSTGMVGEGGASGRSARLGAKGFVCGHDKTRFGDDPSIGMVRCIRRGSDGWCKRH